jgi:predicted DNA-binding transcriptional regulator AlpA
MGKRPKGSIAAWWADSYKLPRDRFLGSADIARRLGVSRQRVSQLRKDPTFPSPGMQGWGVPVWHAAGIECWAAAHRPNRPEAIGRFAPETGDVLIAAERHAERLGIHWIDTGHMWLAIAAGSAGESLAAALDSMGMTPAEIEAYVAGRQTGETRPRRSFRMTPQLQEFLARADRAAAADGRDAVRPIDMLLAFIDAKWERHPEDYRRRSPDNVLSLFDRRGLDIEELRARLVAADAEPNAVAGFEQRKLRKLRRGSGRIPKLDLAPNPLGHDPMKTFPWGAAFARTRDGQHLKVDGEVWFFTIDGDGFYMRAPDGRPVGYRFRMEPPPRIRKGQTYVRPVNGFMEILPMPPVEMEDWPDRQFINDD